jgi:hypothetical protein
MTMMTKIVIGESKLEGRKLAEVLPEVREYITANAEVPWYEMRSETHVTFAFYGEKDALLFKLRFSDWMSDMETEWEVRQRPTFHQLGLINAALPVLQAALPSMTPEQRQQVADLLAELQRKLSV